MRDRDHLLVSECGYQLDLLFCERIHFIAGEREYADRYSFAQQWHAKDGWITECLLIAHQSIFGIDEHVRNVNCSTLQSDSPHNTAAVRLNRMFQRIPLRFGGVAVDSADPKNFSITHLDGALIGRAKPSGRLRQRVEHRLQIERRAADNLEHIGCRRLLLERLTQFIQQPRVLDGNDGLGSKIAHKLDLFVGKRAYLLAKDADCANQLALFEHRDEYLRPRTRELR